MSDQARLFPAEQDDEFLLKHVNAVALMPVQGGRRISLLGRRLFNVLLHRAQGEGARDEYEARLHEIVSDAAYNSNNTASIRKVLRELMSTTVEWQSPTGGEVETWDACNLLSGAGTTKDKRTGAVTIRWRYDQKVREQLLSPDRYARLSLEAITQLSTHSSMALYEICARYVDNPGHRTARQHWRWWRPVLTGAATDDSKAEYRFFKRDVLKPAIAEINANTNLEVRGPIEHKERDNHTIAEIQFEVYLKAAASEPAQARVQIVVDDLPAIGRAINLGVRQNEAEALIHRHGAPAFVSALDELDRRLKMPVDKVGAVFKPGGWLRAHLLRGSRATSAPTPALPEGISPVEVTAHRAAWTDEWLRRRKARLQAGFAELPATPQQVFLDSFRDELVRSAQTQVLKRFDLSGWQHRMVIAVFLRFYGASVLGDQWDKPGIDDILTIAAEFARSGAGPARSEA